VMAFFYLWAYVRRAESEKEEQLADAASL